VEVRRACRARAHNDGGGRRLRSLFFGSNVGTPFGLLPPEKYKKDHKAPQKPVPEEGIENSSADTKKGAVSKRPSLRPLPKSVRDWVGSERGRG
jgi:hypothetical protein